MAQKRLMQELYPLQKEKWVNIEVSTSSPTTGVMTAANRLTQTDDTNLFKWKLGLWVVNPDSVWHGAYLRVSPCLY